MRFNRFFVTTAAGHSFINYPFVMGCCHCLYQYLRIITVLRTLHSSFARWRELSDLQAAAFSDSRKSGPWREVCAERLPLKGYRF